jgi:divalent metal cation (Fe/Co/Zn/Cd) transporter
MAAFDRAHAAKRMAFVLLGITIAYNLAEGVVAIWSGLAAGSIVLVAFGADSYLEVAAAGAVVWRLTFVDDEAGEAAELRVLRFVGWTFVALGLAVTVNSAMALAQGHAAEESGLGIALLAASLAVMPVLAMAKLRTAARANLPALAAEAKETVACSYLSLTALAGLVCVAALGWWWLDAVAALALVPWLLREGFEAVRGDACFDGVSVCFCRRCFGGLRACTPGDGCLPACC